MYLPLRFIIIIVKIQEREREKNNTIINEFHYIAICKSIWSATELHCQQYIYHITTSNFPKLVIIFVIVVHTYTVLALAEWWPNADTNTSAQINTHIRFVSTVFQKFKNSTTTKKTEKIIKNVSIQREKKQHERITICSMFILQTQTIDIISFASWNLQ